MTDSHYSKYERLEVDPRVSGGFSSNVIKSIEGFTLIVTGLHEETQEDDILDEFNEYGKVKNLHMNLDRQTGYVKGYAFLEFESLKEAE